METLKATVYNALNNFDLTTAVFFCERLCAETSHHFGGCSHTSLSLRSHFLPSFPSPLINRSLFFSPSFIPRIYLLGALDPDSEANLLLASCYYRVRAFHRARAQLRGCTSPEGRFLLGVAW